MRHHASQFLLMGAVVVHLKQEGRTSLIRERSDALLPIILSLSQVLLSEGYCYLMEYFQIVGHPPPHIGDFLPLDETLPQAPNLSEEILNGDYNHNFS